MGTAAYRQISGPEGHLAHLRPFEGHSLRGLTASKWSAYWTGRLNSDEAALLQDAYRDGTVRYVVVSYNTPIAWVLNDGTVYCVKQSFSVTTSKQQNYVRAWLGAAVPGTTTNLAHIERGYRVA